MSVNKDRPHLVILPEDDANSSLAHGFQLHDAVNQRAIQILGNAGGWRKVIEGFNRPPELLLMNNKPTRHMLLLIDCDHQADRLDDIRNPIPAHLRDRVFVLGVLSEPEKLKKNTSGGYEAIGKLLADDCHNDTNETWNHPFLRHNAAELERMKAKMKPFLFPRT